MKKEGTSLGLWFTLNGYELNTDWGVKNGYFEAQRNPHFSRFNRYYSLGDPHYNADLRKQLSALIKDGQLNYIKHDFNDMCDTGPHNGTLPTDRHGHEKAVDETLLDSRKWNAANQSRTFFRTSRTGPGSRRGGCSIAIPSGCSATTRASTANGRRSPIFKWPRPYRDAHIFKAWGDPATRPLVPISHLMTHGIVNANGADGRAA